MERGVQVYWAVDATDAHLVAGMLEEEGIRAEIENEMLASGLGELPLGPASAPRVLVHESDAGRARAIVEDWESNRARETARTWTCGDCGEEVDATLGVCDFCHTPRGVALPKPEPELCPRHAIAIFVVWFVTPIFVGFVLAMLGLSIGASIALSSVAEAFVLVKLTQSVLGGSLGDRGRAMVGLVDASVRQLLFGAVVGFVLAGGYYFAALWYLPPDLSEPGVLDELGRGSAAGFALYMLIALGIAPFFEEFLFRGVMLRGFQQRWGSVVSVVIVTLLFALVHIAPNPYWPDIAFVAIGGLVAALLRIRTGSLYPAVASHFCNNLFMGIWFYFYASPSW